VTACSWINLDETCISCQKFETLSRLKKLGTNLKCYSGSSDAHKNKSMQSEKILSHYSDPKSDQRVPFRCYVFRYAHQTWITTADLQWRIQDLDIRCYCKILSMSH